MQEQTLEELRQEVDAEEADATQSTEKPTAQAAGDDDEDPEPPPLAASAQSADSDLSDVTDESDDSDEATDSETDVELEDWQLADEQASDATSGKKPKLFTGDDVRGARLKERMKTEKRLAKEHETELAQMRAELDALKKGAPVSNANGQPVQVKPMPTLEGHDYDEARYAQAMQQWVGETVQNQIHAISSTSQQKQQQQQQNDRLNQAVNDHYERAAELATTAGIAADVFQQSDLEVRSAIDRIMPGAGDVVTDGLIAHLGDGSEKVLYYLGRNSNKLAELTSHLARDPSGLSAAVYMGQLKATLNTPKKRTSQAPAPARQIRGDAKPKHKATALKKQYDKAVQGNDAQAMYNARKSARAQGVDVSGW